MGRNRLVTPEGTKDYLYEEAIAIRSVEQRLKTLFEKHGFCEVLTPGVEFLDVFSDSGHSMPVEYMYKLTDSSGRLMALRPDSTMPIARLAATRLKQSLLPLRLYYNQPIYLTTRSMSGASDEVIQAGIELIGASSVMADLEVITTAIQSLVECESKGFRLEIGHIGVFNTLVSALKIDDTVKEQIRMLIEFKNYPALNDLLDSLGRSEEVAVLKQLPRLFGDRSVFQKALKIIKDKETIEVLSYLEGIYLNLQGLGYGDSISVDLGLVTRNDYYTGIVFKGYIEGNGFEALSGGRYDGLISQYGTDMGACGFAVNVQAVAKTILAEEKVNTPPPEAIVWCDANHMIEGLQCRQRLSVDMVCELSLFDSLEKTREYARAKGIKQVYVAADEVRAFDLPENKIST